MKLLPILLAGAALAVADSSPGLKEVHAVYLLPMAGGLDQLLAVRLTHHGLFEVVTDPAKADAVFTERIGANFEEAFKELYDSKAAKEAKDKDDGYTKPASKPMGQSKGSLFLVDRKNRNVVWSIYEKPPSSGVTDLHRFANRVGDQLEKDIKGK